MVSVLHAGRHQWKLKTDHAVLAGCCHACPVMSKVPQNNKSPTCVERVE